MFPIIGYKLFYASSGSLSAKQVFCSATGKYKKRKTASSLKRFLKFLPSPFIPLMFSFKFFMETSNAHSCVFLP